MKRAVAAALLMGAAANAAACGGAPERERGALAGGSKGGARVEVRSFAERPRLTIVARDGDPVGALVFTVVTDQAPSVTTALAAVVEARVKAAGFDVDTRATRASFRVRSTDARVKGVVEAVARAFALPIGAGAPELGFAAQRVASLKRHPLDAVELAPIATCTGALAIAPGEKVIDVKAGFAELEAARKKALTAPRTAIGAVGGEAFVKAAEDAVSRGPAWPDGGGPDDPAAVVEETAAYAARTIERRAARLSIAIAVEDPGAAAAAAEALGDPGGPLATRLLALAEPFRVASVVGAARPRGGCVSVVLEADGGGGEPVDAAAATATAVAKREIEIALAASAGAEVATREVLTAGDPREAASRASWWALAGKAGGGDKRWAVALGVAPSASGGAPEGLAAKLKDQIARAATLPQAQRRVGVERGQGELWVLVASPCGTGDEGFNDAGLGAISVVATAQQARDRRDVRLEPWVTTDGLGLIAHAAPRDDESPIDLARRVGDAAARAITTSRPSQEGVVAARTSIVQRLERFEGRQGIAFEALTGALAPGHPSWISPFGVWSRVAGAGTDDTRARARALAGGPLRVAVLANADEAQAAAAASAVDRWMAPGGERACRPSAAEATRAGKVDVVLPSETRAAQVVVGVPVEASGRVFADVAAALLDGEKGALGRALRDEASVWSARVLGGSRGAALVVDARVPDGDAAGVATIVKSTLLHLGEGVTDADVARVNEELARRDAEAKLDPRARVAALWSGAPPRRATVTAAGLRSFLATSVREASFVVVEARTN